MPLQQHNNLSAGYITGLIFIFLVALIWAASSVLVQYLYTDFEFDSPFLLTYIGSSLFTLWLPTKFISNYCKSASSTTTTRLATTTTTTITRIKECLGWGRRNSNSSQVETTNLRHPGEHVSVPRYTQVVRNEDDDGDEAEVATEGVDNDGNEDYPEQSSPSPLIWTNEQHIRTAMYIAPVWFMANWTYNASLQQTSVTSSTVLASTGSLFTFLFAVVGRDEKFGWLKLAGVVLGVTGSICTAFSDVSGSHIDDDESGSYYYNDYDDNSNNNGHFMFVRRFLRHGGEHVSGQQQQHALRGDLLGLLSAIGYGGYAVQTRMLCPHDESLYSMQLVLGYIGIMSFIVLSPIVLYLIWTKNDQLLSSWWVLGALIIKGLLDNVLSDYLWLRAVMLTNATVATVGLGMTIPLAFISDIVWLKKSSPQVLNLFSIMGAISVLLGFVLVNVGNNNNNNDNNNQAAVTVPAGVGGGGGPNNNNNMGDQPDTTTDVTLNDHGTHGTITSPNNNNSSNYRDDDFVIEDDDCRSDNPIQLHTIRRLD